MLGFGSMRSVPTTALPPDLLTRVTAPTGAVARTDAAIAYGAAATGSRPADSVSVKPLLFELDQEHLATFSALGETTRDRILALHEAGAVTADEVTAALNLPLVKARNERYNEMRKAALTDAERTELAAIEERAKNPKRDSERAIADLRRQQEIWLDLPKTPGEVTGIPLPAGHPGVQIGRVSDLMAAQKLRELGVDVNRDPDFGKRLRGKLDSGELEMVSGFSAELAAAQRS